MSKHNEKSIKQAIEELLNTYRLKEGLTEVRLKSSWDKIVGPMIAKHTKEMHIKNKVMIISLDSAALRQELMYAKEKLISLLNEAAGEKIIEEIVLR